MDQFLAHFEKYIHLYFLYWWKDSQIIDNPFIRDDFVRELKSQHDIKFITKVGVKKYSIMLSIVSEGLENKKNHPFGWFFIIKS